MHRGVSTQFLFLPLFLKQFSTGLFGPRVGSKGQCSDLWRRTLKPKLKLLMNVVIGLNGVGTPSYVKQDWVLDCCLLTTHRHLFFSKNVVSSFQGALCSTYGWSFAHK